MDSLEGRLITVTGTEAVHALRVLRLGVGDPVILFDGRNREIQGRIVAVAPDRLDVEPTAPLQVQTAPDSLLTLIVATPKGARADWLVEKAAELGVSRLWLLEATRGSVRPGEGKLIRWRRKAIEASKQARLSQVMEIAAPRSLDELCGLLRTCAAVLYGEPSDASEAAAQAIPRACHHADSVDEPVQARASPPNEIAVIIGPEGGLTGVERSRLQDIGARPIRFATSILRVETAAIACAALWAGHLCR